MALFSYNLSTSKWLKRSIYTFFLLLVCLGIQLIPMNIQTKIVTKRISHYMDRKREKFKLNEISKNDEKRSDMSINTSDPIDAESYNQHILQYELEENSNHKNRHGLITEKSDPAILDSKKELFEDEDLGLESMSVSNTSNEIVHKRKKLIHLRNAKTCKRMRLELGANQRSILASFGKGRLGNKLSSFASCYAIAKDFGVYNYISENQYIMLRRVFNFPSLKDDREDSPYYVWRKGKF